MNIKQRGFSLLELLVVMGIVAIIAAISVPSFAGFQLQAGYDEEVKAVRDLISDARANAISGKQCTDGTDKVQSLEWSVKFTRDPEVNNDLGESSGYFAQLMCLPISALDDASIDYGDNATNGEFIPQAAAGHSGGDLKREFSRNGRVSRMFIVARDGTIDEKTLSVNCGGGCTQAVYDQYKYNFYGIHVSFAEEGTQAYVFSDYDTATGSASIYGITNSYADSIYIGMEHVKLRKTLDSTRGICMNVNQGFPSYPCSLDITF